MPHATMQLIPGIDTNKTPALNEAAFSQSQLIRFIPDRNGKGLIQKLGGWVNWANGVVIPNITELRAWEDLNGNQRLAVGADNSLSYISNATRTQTVITPQVTTSDAPAAPGFGVTISGSPSTAVFSLTFPSITSATYASGIGTITFSAPHGLTNGDTIVLTGFTPSAWNSTFQVTVAAVNVVTINITTTTATVTGSAASSLVVGTPVVFSTTNSLPSGLNAGQVYYVAASPAPTTTTFSVVTSPQATGTAIVINSAGSGTQTAVVPIATTTSGSSVVTIYDTGLGFQSGVTFSNNSTATVVTSGYTPVANTAVTFYPSPSASLPTGISSATTYYVKPLTATTFNLATSPTSSTFVGTTSTGGGNMFAPNQIRTGFNSWVQTPISIANLLISGVYNVTNYTTSNTYSIYTIDTGVVANATTANSTVPTFTPDYSGGVGFSDVTVTEINHPYYTGATATFLVPTTGSGLTIYGNYPVTYISSTQYRITASTAATSSNVFAMDYSSVRFEYFFNIGSASAALGYGNDGYGNGGYGAGVPAAYPNTTTVTTSDWSINNFGEILVANPQGGAIYYWSPTNNTTTAFLLSTAPAANQGIFIAMPARQLVAYGSTVTGIQDPLLVRWSDAGDATTWIAAANNQAGSYRIPEGSLIVGAIQGPQQALIWTDLSVWAMQYVGLPNVYGFNKLADGAGLIAKKACGLMNGITYWMSQNKFMSLGGSSPEPILCPVWDKVFQNINPTYYETIRCAPNSVFGEVSWYYTSNTNYPVTGITVGATYTISSIGTTDFTTIGAASNTVGTIFTATATGTGTGTVTVTENDSYVKYNVGTQQWDYGTLNRSAWTDQSVLGTPIGSGTNGVIYQHEIGYNNDTLPMISSFETGYIQLNEADNLVFVDQIWPDFKWQTASGSSVPATLYITFYGTNYPGDTPVAYGPYTMTQGTEYISVRIRSRLLAISVSTSPNNSTADLNSFFRIGAVRYRYQLDGKF